jgi:NADH dehydrogenase/NADH:ubiquinone oxidoreductase subunit G
VQKIGGKFARVGAFVARNEPALWCATNGASADFGALRDADAIIVLGARPSRTHGVIAAGIRVAARRRGAKLLIFHAPKSDLDRYATLCTNMVSMERHFWKRVAEELGTVKRPVLVYGPNAMTAIGVTVLERLTEIFETNQSAEALQLLALPTSANSHALKAANIEPVEEAGPWLESIKFLHLVASDEPDGGARFLNAECGVPSAEFLNPQSSTRTWNGFLVVQASYESALTGLANVVLPAAAWAEKTGTITSAEGRQLPLRAAIACGVGSVEFGVWCAERGIPQSAIRNPHLDDGTILETIYA